MAKTDDPNKVPHLLVVIDHQEARVYRTEVHGAVPMRIVPYDPHGYGKHLHSAQEWTDGKRQPERKSFYEAIARTGRCEGPNKFYCSGAAPAGAVRWRFCLPT